MVFGYHKWKKSPKKTAFHLPTGGLACSNTQTVYVEMKHEPYIILKLLLNFSTFEPQNSYQQYSYQQYSYKKVHM